MSQTLPSTCRQPCTCSSHAAHLQESEQSFLEEIKLLKASISDKDKQEGAIQKQISLLQVGLAKRNRKK